MSAAFLAIDCVSRALGLKVGASAVLHATKIPVSSLPVATTRYCIRKFLHLRYGVGFLTKYMAVNFCMDHGGLQSLGMSIPAWGAAAVPLYCFLGKILPSPTVFWWAKPSAAASIEQAGVTVSLQNCTVFGLCMRKRCRGFQIFPLLWEGNKYTLQHGINSELR